jgi:glutamyl-tRNA synthetase
MAIHALHVLLYRAFGWEAPEFAHLPLIMKPVGNGKLSNVMVTRWDSLYFHWIGKTKRRFIRLQRKGFSEAVINF